MNGWRGIFAGALALAALEAVLSTRQAADRTAGLLGDVASIVTRALDPTVAAIPDIAGAYSAQTSSAPADLPTPALPMAPATRKPKARKPVVAPPPGVVMA